MRAPVRRRDVRGHRALQPGPPSTRSARDASSTDWPGSRCSPPARPIIEFSGMNATTLLVRRVKQGVAEWLRHQIKEKSMAGPREHTLDG